MQNKKIAENFSKWHLSYDSHANVQAQVAQTLCDLLPQKENPKILEIGCGTGFLTRLLFQKYPKGSFDITDLSLDMVHECKKKYPNSNARYFIMDGENFSCHNKYDLIVSSMAFQWFQNPQKTLKKLSKKGNVYFSTLGQDNFKEWKTILKQHNLQDKTLNITTWPHILKEDITKIDYQNGLKFLKILKQTGASISLSNDQNYNYSAFKRALCAFDGRVSWHIVYGFQPCDNTVIGT